MKKYKNDIKTIVEVLSLFVIFLSISAFDNPLVTYLFLAVWVVYLIYSLISKIRYRKGKSKYILFPTLNDQYSKVTSLTLGIICLILSIVAIIWTKSYIHYGITGIAISLLVFLNGVFDLPKGWMQVDQNELSLSGLENIIDVRQLKEINIYKERIILTNVYDEIKRVESLNIDANSARQIENYISKHANNLSIQITNNVG